MFGKQTESEISTGSAIKLKKKRYRYLLTSSETIQNASDGASIMDNSKGMN